MNNELFLDVSNKKRGTFISCLNVWTENVNMDWTDRIGRISTQRSGAFHLSVSTLENETWLISGTATWQNCLQSNAYSDTSKAPVLGNMKAMRLAKNQQEERDTIRDSLELYT